MAAARSSEGRWEHGTLLVVVIDTNPVAWYSGADTRDAMGLTQTLEQLCLFLNAFRMFHADNRLAVVTSHPHGAHLHVRAADELSSYRDELIPGLLAWTAAQPPPEVSTTSLSASLSLALCHVRKNLPEEMSRKQAQILALVASPDDPRQYISVMNCIFAAQKQSVPVDSFLLGACSPFLQQAAHLTDGIYLEVTTTERTALSQLLILHALPDRRIRERLTRPPGHDVDFRAACFLTNQMLEVASVCSVCLSVFHPTINIIECPACKSRFRPPGALRSKRAAPPGGGRQPAKKAGDAVRVAAAPG